MKRTIALLLAFVFVLSALNLTVIAAESADEYEAYFSLESDDFEVNPGDTVKISLVANDAYVKSFGVDITLADTVSFSKSSWVSKNLKVALVDEPDPDDPDDWAEPLLKDAIKKNSSTGTLDPAALTYAPEVGAVVLNGSVFTITLNIDSDFTEAKTVSVNLSIADRNDEEQRHVFSIPVSLHPHIHDWVLESSTPSTCSVKGSAVYKCSSCDETKTEELELDPEKHENTELRGASDATCTEPGYTGDTYCADCGVKLADGEVITAPGHSFGGWTVTVPATCSAKGAKERVCEVCKAIETEEIDIDPANHAKTELRGASDATCTEPGYTGDTYCAECGVKLADGQAIEAAGHKYGQWDIVTAPTEASDGERIHVCTVCKAEETGVIPALSEQNGYTVSVKEEPTAVSEGVKEWVSEEYGVFTTPIPKLDATLRVVLGDGDYYFYDIGETQYVMVKSARNPLPEGVFVRNIKDGSYKTADDQVVGNRLTLEIDGDIVDEAVIILLGDYNYDGKVNSADAVFLLRHTLFPEKFPLNQSGDLNKDQKVSSADAILLLRHTLFPEKFPLSYPG